MPVYVRVCDGAYLVQLVHAGQTKGGSRVLPSTNLITAPVGGRRASGAIAAETLQAGQWRWSEQRHKMREACGGMKRGVPRRQLQLGLALDLQ